MSLALLLGMMLLGMSLDALSNDDEPASEDEEVANGDSGDTPVTDVAALVGDQEDAAAGDSVLIEEFDAEQDVVVVEVAGGSTDPDVTVEDDNGTSVLALDGAEVARVQAVNGALTADAVRLVEAG